jgi:hypothetical protein
MSFLPEVVEALGGLAEAGGIIPEIGGGLAEAGGAIGDIGGAIGDGAGALAGDIGAAAGDIGAAAGDLGGAVSGAVDAGVGGVESAADAAANAVNGGVDVVADGAAEAAEEVPEAANSLASTIKDNAIKLGKWAAIETAKGAVMSAGFIGLQKVIAALPSGSPEKSALQALADADSNAYNTLNTVANDWHTFLQVNAATGDQSFGSVTVQGMAFTQFSLLKSSIAAWDANNTSTIPQVLQTANTNKDMPSLTALQTVLQQSFTKAIPVATVIQTNQAAMIQAGLKDHLADLKSGSATLSDA